MMRGRATGVASEDEIFGYRVLLIGTGRFLVFGNQSAADQEQDIS
jgi:hypothetical protein